ncbi:MAG: hypothetical protein FWH04_03995 [Oscillospiraceae bacterium]|nr:hypothetical protein [Oscillospiraceae bacterium]
MKFYRLYILVAVCFLLASCSEKNNVEDVSPEPSPNNEGDSEYVRYCNSKSDLAELLDVDFTNLEIVDVEVVDDCKVYVFCDGADDALQHSNFGQNEAPFISFPDRENLEKMGIKESNVQATGDKSRAEPMADPNIDEAYMVFWYQLDRNHPKKGNIVLSSRFSYKVEVDVDKITSQN